MLRCLRCENARVLSRVPECALSIHLCTWTKENDNQQIQKCPKWHYALLSCSSCFVEILSFKVCPCEDLYFIWMAEKAFAMSHKKSLFVVTLSRTEQFLAHVTCKGKKVLHFGTFLSLNKNSFVTEILKGIQDMPKLGAIVGGLLFALLSPGVFNQKTYSSGSCQAVWIQALWILTFPPWDWFLSWRLHGVGGSDALAKNMFFWVFSSDFEVIALSSFLAQFLRTFLGHTVAEAEEWPIWVTLRHCHHWQDHLLHPCKSTAQSNPTQKKTPSTSHSNATLFMGCLDADKRPCFLLRDIRRVHSAFIEML